MWYTYKKYIDENEEVRCWFKVSVNRKKVWNIQLGLLEELKKICEKHNLNYYADSWTLLGAVRHKWFIPWDDDMDIAMFREDYEKLWEVAKKELPDHIKLCVYHQWYSKLINTDTAALWDENRWDKDFVGWIWIDIFPMDYASRYMIINRFKFQILTFLRVILLSQKCYWFVKRMKKWKRFFVYLFRYIFSWVKQSKIYQLHEKISKKVLFKGNDVYSWFYPFLFLPDKVYNNFHNVKFENTLISIPDWYDVWLKTRFNDYMTPVIYEWWHHARYSVDESYKNIIKTFDKKRLNEDNYNDCELLFTL